MRGLHSQHVFQVLKDTQWTQWCPMRMKLLHLCPSVDSSLIHLNRGKLNLQAAQVCVSRGAGGICSERCWLVLLGTGFSS